MKCTFKSLLLVLVAMLCSTSLFAHYFKVDGIYYNITSAEDMTVEVTYRGYTYGDYNNEYSGTVTIPESVSYNEKTYSVTSIGNWAFAECSGLTSVTIPNGVKSIGNNAFYCCSGLTSVTIPNSVTSIGDYAFDECSGLTSITIPNSVTSIGHRTFSYCRGLTSVTIPNSVTSIGMYAFYRCSGLTSITIPNSVTSIDEQAFDGTAWYNNQPDGVVYAGNVLYKCKGTLPDSTSIKVKAGTVSISPKAFLDCTGLTSITIPNSVKSIGESAFQACYSLSSITIPNSITSIEDHTFYNCNGLTSVIIPNSVTSIGMYAFTGCGLTSITIPNSVKSIGYSAFGECSDLTTITIPNSVKSIEGDAFLNTAWYNNRPDGLIYINNILYQYKGEIPENTNIAVKESTLSISPFAFQGQVGLTSITIPNSVTSIGDGAFSGCRGLTSITIPNSVTSIGSSAFSSCSGLTSVIIPNSVTSIGNSAFRACSGLTSITIPNSVTSIGNSAFEDCSGLTSITIGNGVTSIGEWTFYGCSGLTSVTIPNSVTSIGWSTFRDCSGLTSISIPNSVTSIGGYAFAYCSRLTSITIPNSVTSIGGEAFRDCSGLTSITIPNSVTSIGSWAFCGCSRLTSITIPNSVTSIVYSTFEGCSGLTSVTIPNSVTRIGSSAFYKCYGLTSVTIPNSVDQIDNYAFANCENLTEVISYIPAEKLFSVSDETFRSIPSSCVLTVPAGAKATYEATEGWSVFNEIVEIPSNLQEGVDFVNPEPFQAATVTYSRTLPNLMWNALYLPVQIPFEALSDNYDVAYFNNMHAYDHDNNGEIDDMKMEVFLVKEGTLRANYPYLIRAKNEAAKQLDLELTDVKVHSTNADSCTTLTTSSVFMNFELKGVYERHEGTELEDCYAITAKGSWSPIATNSYLNPYRLYLKMTPRPGSPVIVSPQALQSIRISVQGEDELTAIEAPIVNGQNATEIYDLQGRRVTNPKKGMYIVNGKKVMF